jgi:hypothetical protein
MIRDEVKELQKMGPLPSEEESIRNPSPLLEKYQQLIQSIEKPVTDEEARVLIGVFGVDGCFGVDWTLIHLIETAPSWPIEECLKNVENESINMLKGRAERWRNAGYPRRSFYKEAGLPDPRRNQDSRGDGDSTPGENKS